MGTAMNTLKMQGGWDIKGEKLIKAHKKRNLKLLETPANQ